jgi:NADH pyrophosphatase NudC (nudix superfamily)
VIRKDHYNLERKACSNQQCDWVFYDNPVIIVAAIIEHFNHPIPQQQQQSSSSASPSASSAHHVLQPVSSSSSSTNEQPHIILARGVGWPENWFGVITGYLEKNEDIVSACYREVKEEIGLDSYNARFIGIYPFYRANQIIVAYTVQCSGDIKLDTSELQVSIQPVKSYSCCTTCVYDTDTAVNDHCIAKLHNSSDYSNYHHEVMFTRG